MERHNSEQLSVSSGASPVSSPPLGEGEGGSREEACLKQDACKDEPRAETEIRDSVSCEASAFCEASGSLHSSCLAVFRSAVARLCKAVAASRRGSQTLREALLKAKALLEDDKEVSAQPPTEDPSPRVSGVAEEEVCKQLDALLSPFVLALSAESSKLHLAALDACNDLLAFGLFTPASSPLFTSDPLSQGGSACPAGLREGTAAFSTSALAALLSAVCTLGHSPDEAVCLQVVRCLLSALTATAPVARGAALADVLSALLGIFARGGSDSNSRTAFAALVQAVASLTRRANAEQEPTLKEEKALDVHQTLAVSRCPPSASQTDLLFCVRALCAAAAGEASSGVSGQLQHASTTSPSDLTENENTLLNSRRAALELLRCAIQGLEQRVLKRPFFLDLFRGEVLPAFASAARSPPLCTLALKAALEAAGIFRCSEEEGGLFPQTELGASLAEFVVDVPFSLVASPSASPLHKAQALRFLKDAFQVQPPLALEIFAEFDLNEHARDAMSCGLLALSAALLADRQTVSVGEGGGGTSLTSAEGGLADLAASALAALFASLLRWVQSVDEREEQRRSNGSSDTETEAPLTGGGAAGVFEEALKRGPSEDESQSLPRLVSAGHRLRRQETASSNAASARVSAEDVQRLRERKRTFRRAVDFFNQKRSAAPLQEILALKGLPVRREKEALPLQRRKPAANGLRLEEGERGSAERFFALQPEAEDMARLLLSPAFHKAAVGDFLGGDGGDSKAVLNAFVALLDFRGDLIDAALRRFLGLFRLPGEAQKIDRLMEKFAEKYFLDNNPNAEKCSLSPSPESLSSTRALRASVSSPKASSAKSERESSWVFDCADACYVLSFSLIMLHTDLHSRQIKPEHKMTKEEFVKNNRGINAGKDLPRPFLEALYDRIAAEEWTLQDSAAQTVQRPFSPALVFSSGARTLPLGGRAPAAEGGERQSERVVRSPLSEEALRGLVCFFVETAVDPCLAALTNCLGASGEGDGETGSGNITSAQTAVLEMASALVALVCREGPRGSRSVLFGALRNLSGLDEVESRRLRAAHACVCALLLNAGVKFADSIQDSWLHVLFVASQLDFLQGFRQKPLKTPLAGAAPASLSFAQNNKSAPDTPLASAVAASGPGVSERLSFPRGVFVEDAENRASGLGRVGGVSSSSASLGGGLGFSGTAAFSSLRSISESESVMEHNASVMSVVDLTAVDLIVNKSGGLSASSIETFVKDLRAVSATELSLPQPRTFSLQKLVEVAAVNIGRVKFVWAKVWAVLSAHFAEVCVHPVKPVCLYALDSLRQLAGKFIEKSERAVFHFQREFLQPFFLVLTNPRVSEDVKEYTVHALRHLVLSRGALLQSGWKCVASCLHASAADVSAKAQETLRQTSSPQSASEKTALLKRLAGRLALTAQAASEIVDGGFVRCLGEGAPEAVACLGALAANPLEAKTARQALRLLERCADAFLGEEPEARTPQDEDEDKDKGEDEDCRHEREASPSSVAALAETAPSSGDSSSVLGTAALSVVLTLAQLSTLHLASSEEPSSEPASQKAAVEQGKPQGEAEGDSRRVLAGSAEASSAERQEREGSFDAESALSQREAALKALFRLLLKYGSRFGAAAEKAGKGAMDEDSAAEFWQIVIRGALLPVFEDLLLDLVKSGQGSSKSPRASASPGGGEVFDRLSREGKTAAPRRGSSEEDAFRWALQQTLLLLAQNLKTLRGQLAPILSLILVGLGDCSCEAGGRLSVEALRLLIQSLKSSLKESSEESAQIWDALASSLEAAFLRSTPVELLSLTPISRAALDESFGLFFEALADEGEEDCRGTEGGGEDCGCVFERRKPEALDWSLFAAAEGRTDASGSGEARPEEEGALSASVSASEALPFEERKRLLKALLPQLATLRPAALEQDRAAAPSSEGGVVVEETRRSMKTPTAGDPQGFCRETPDARMSGFEAESIAAKCVAQLLLIEVVDVSFLHLGRKSVATPSSSYAPALALCRQLRGALCVWPLLPQKEVTPLIAFASTDVVRSLAFSLERSFLFAQMFNSQVELRRSLQRRGFMAELPQLPGLLKQHRKALASLSALLADVALAPLGGDSQKESQAFLASAKGRRLWAWQRLLRVGTWLVKALLRKEAKARRLRKSPAASASEGDGGDGGAACGGNPEQQKCPQAVQLAECNRELESLKPLIEGCVLDRIQDAPHALLEGDVSVVFSMVMELQASDSAEIRTRARGALKGLLKKQLAGSYRPISLTPANC